MILLMVERDLKDDNGNVMLRSGIAYAPVGEEEVQGQLCSVYRTETMGKLYVKK